MATMSHGHTSIHKHSYAVTYHTSPTRNSAQTKVIGCPLSIRGLLRHVDRQLDIYGRRTLTADPQLSNCGGSSLLFSLNFRLKRMAPNPQPSERAVAAPVLQQFRGQFQLRAHVREWRVLLVACFGKPRSPWCQAPCQGAWHQIFENSLCGCAENIVCHSRVRAPCAWRMGATSDISRARPSPRVS